MEFTGMNESGMPEQAKSTKVLEEVSALSERVELSVEQLDEVAGGNSSSHFKKDFDVKISKGQLPGVLQMIFRIKGDVNSQ